MTLISIISLTEVPLYFRLAFITSDGYFFNNLGFDRYGGRLDKDGNYLRVSPAKIEDRDKVQPPPHYEPPKYETSDADHAFKGLDDGYVGEEDFGDDEIFGKSQGAPKYCKKYSKIRYEKGRRR